MPGVLSLVVVIRILGRVELRGLVDAGARVDKEILYF